MTSSTTAIIAMIIALPFWNLDHDHLQLEKDNNYENHTRILVESYTCYAFFLAFICVWIRIPISILHTYDYYRFISVAVAVKRYLGAFHVSTAAIVLKIYFFTFRN